MSSTDGSGRSILLIEPDEAVRRILAAEVQAWGLSVHQTASIEQALQTILRRGPFVAVISAEQLPDGTGLFLRNWLGEQGLGIPFILLADGAPGKASGSGDHFALIQKPCS
jgi:DNA-binding NtrC family response regulator